MMYLSLLSEIALQLRLSHEPSLFPQHDSVKRRRRLKSFARSGDLFEAVLAAWRHETNRLPPQRPRSTRPPSLRSRTLADSTEKTRALMGMVEAIKGAAGTLLFTITIDSADSIAATLRQWGVSTNALHSRLRRADRRQLLRQFEQQQLAAIVAPMVLDEGVDVPKRTSLSSWRRAEVNAR
jgi:superfamily II DNA or RNA helicase